MKFEKVVIDIKSMRTNNSLRRNILLDVMVFS